jgi:hypothetical protein
MKTVYLYKDPFNYETIMINASYFPQCIKYDEKLYIRNSFDPYCVGDNYTLIENIFEVK